MSNIENPPYYKLAEPEVIDLIRACCSDSVFYAHCCASALAYICRAPFKHDAVADLRKADVYLVWAEQADKLLAWTGVEFVAESDDVHAEWRGLLARHGYHHAALALDALVRSDVVDAREHIAEELRRLGGTK